MFFYIVYLLIREYHIPPQKATNIAAQWCGILPVRTIWGSSCTQGDFKFQFIDQSLPLGEGAPKGRMRVEQMRLRGRKRKFKR